MTIGHELYAEAYWLVNILGIESKQSQYSQTWQKFQDSLSLSFFITTFGVNVNYHSTCLTKIMWKSTSTANENNTALIKSWMQISLDYQITPLNNHCIYYL